MDHGHAIRSSEDGEVVAHAYEQWVEHLWGEFVLALWDDETSMLLLARDRIGTMPDHLSAGYEHLKANEIESTKALLERWIEETGNLGQRFLILYIPSELQVKSAHGRAVSRNIDLDAAHRWLTVMLNNFSKSGSVAG